MRGDYFAITKSQLATFMAVAFLLGMVTALLFLRLMFVSGLIY